MNVVRVEALFVIRVEPKVNSNNMPLPTTDYLGYWMRKLRLGLTISMQYVKGISIYLSELMLGSRSSE